MNVIFACNHKNNTRNKYVLSSFLSFIIVALTYFNNSTPQALSLRQAILTLKLDS